MDDFTKISGLRDLDEMADEGQETAYLEIVEYIRICVLLMHEQLRGGDIRGDGPDGAN